MAGDSFVDLMLDGVWSKASVTATQMGAGKNEVAATAVERERMEEWIIARVREGRPLSELAAVMTRSPQVLVNVKVDRKRPLDELAAVGELIRAVERDLGDDGRVLVRYSGTEAKARVMIEGPDEAAIRERAQAIADALVVACRV